MRRPVQIHHDKETYSEIDLTAVGAYAYVMHDTTDCLVTSGLVDFGGRTGRERKLRRWRIGDDYPYDDIDPDEIEILAWNSQFERLMWNRVMVPLYGWPKLKLEQFVCVSAQARMMAAGPAKLEKAAPFYRRKVRKDMAGNAHMRKMCRPATEAQQLEFMKAHPLPGNALERYAVMEEAKRCHHTKAAMDRLHDYCDPDVWTAVGIHDVLPDWHPDDLAAFHLNERINDRGMIVDIDFARAAVSYADDEKEYFAKEIALLTGGKVTKITQAARILKLLLELMSDDARKVSRYYEDGGEKYSLDADTRHNLLSEAARDLDWLAYDPEFVSTFTDPENGDEFDLSDGELIAEILELRDDASKSAVSKYQAILNRAVHDFNGDGLWRVHGCYMLAGASQSTRFSSTGIQVHNLVRDVPPNAVALIEAIKDGDKDAVLRECQVLADAHNAKIMGEINTDARPEQFDAAGKKRQRGTGGKKQGVSNKGRLMKPTPIHALARLVRPAITADPDDGFDLLWCDWSSIEACVLPWLSLDPRADDRLAMFRRGEDVYSHTASGILTLIEGRKVTITKADDFERQAYGKVPDLSLGYLGGVGALQAMARNYGVYLDDDTAARTVKAWRERNPWAVDFGDRAETMAMRALERPGVSYSAGRLEYLYDADMLDGMGALLCILPSGKELVYPDARIEPVTTKWGKVQPGITAAKSAWNPKKGEEDWPRVSLWKGLLVENAAQAVATGEILRLGLARCEAAGLAVCAHTHDEIMIETADPLRDGPRLEKLMTTRPPWPGTDCLPLRAEWGYGYRYKVKEPADECQ